MPDNRISEKIYEYDNYRFFLNDFFAEQKTLKESFSHRAFAKKAGFASSSFFSHVVDGKRNLTDNSTEKMIKGISLRGKKATFFRTLVQYNQADTVENRENLYKKLSKIRKSSNLFAVSQKQWQYYDEWYYPVIRELAPSPNWDGDYKKLGMLVSPAITPDKAKKAVNLLLEIGMLTEENGQFIQAHEGVTAKDVPSVVTRKMRREYIHLAEEAMENLPLEERLISGVTVTLTEQQYKEIEIRLNEIRQLILSEGLGEAEGEGKVFQINFQMFPLSDTIALDHPGGDNE